MVFCDFTGRTLRDRQENGGEGVGGNCSGTAAGQKQTGVTTRRIACMVCTEWAEPPERPGSSIIQVLQKNISQSNLNGIYKYCICYICYTYTFVICTCILYVLHMLY
jgi:hypothetical protein